MLVKFAVNGYRGFERRIEWDLTKVRGYEFNPSAIKDGAIKNGIIYGHNGSGKSNFSLAVFDIVNHLSQKWKKPDYYSNFVFAGSPHALVDFEYTFVFDGKPLEYKYSKTRRGVLQKESLFFGGEEVFSRDHSSLWVNAALFPIEEERKQSLSKNANNVSVANFLLSAYPLEEGHFLIRLQDFANSMLWFRCLEEREFIGLEDRIYIIDEYILEKGLEEDFQAFLKETSGQEFSFCKGQGGEKRLFCSIGGGLARFHDIASTGTHSLTLLYFWIKRMEDASLVFIDEFDAFYHVELSRAVCKRLFSLAKPQVFLTTHNTRLLANDLLRPDCNFLLENNEIRALHDCTEKELRQGNNMEKLYRGGEFAL